jgi:hypothetical protein
MKYQKVIGDNVDNKAKKPSVYTLIYWLVQDKKMDPEALLNFVELFWPTFIEKEGYVFLKETFSLEEYNRLKEEDNPEFWINLLTVDDFFSEASDWQEKSQSLSKSLVEMWRAKLEIDFPTLEFTVKYLCDPDVGDYGLTFYQTINRNDQK